MVGKSLSFVPESFNQCSTHLAPHPQKMMAINAGVSAFWRFYILNTQMKKVLDPNMAEPLRMLPSYPVQSEGPLTFLLSGLKVDTKANTQAEPERNTWPMTISGTYNLCMYIYIYMYDIICIYGAASAGPPPPPMGGGSKGFPPPVVSGWFVVLWYSV